MRKSASWKLPAVAGLAGVALALSLAGFAALAWRAGPFMGQGGLGFSDAHDQAAFAILSRGTTPQALSEAAAEDKRALALSPYDNVARLRLAYIETLQRNAMGPDAAARFAQSYDLAPYDHTVAAWRIGFGLENWGALTPDVRREVFAEAKAFGNVGSHDVPVGQVLKSIRDPQGRLAAALWLHTLKD